MEKIKLGLPLKHIFVTQPFGVNFLDFYKKLGMKGHNGVDFKAKNGCKVYAAHAGKVLFAGQDMSGGVEVILWNEKQRYKTIYYHLLKVSVEKDQSIIKGQVIGLADNTGRYTTGSHLHFGLKLTNKYGGTLDWNNGYRGAIDPTPYFPKNWDKPPAYHRYGRKSNWWVEFWFRFTPIKVNNRWTKAGRWVQRQLKKRHLPLLNTIQVNAILYGGWDFESVINPAMYELYAYLTKYEYLAGKKPFA